MEFNRMTQKIGAFHGKSTACSEVRCGASITSGVTYLARGSEMFAKMVLGTDSCRVFYALVGRLDWRWWAGTEVLKQRSPMIRLAF